MGFKSFVRCFLMGLIVLISGVIHAQQANSGSEIYLLQNTSLIEINHVSMTTPSTVFNSTTNHTPLSLVVPSSSESIQKPYIGTSYARMSADQATVYMLKTFTDEKGLFVTNASLVAWDRRTDTESILYNEHGVVYFSASPDMLSVVVFYHSGEFATSRIKACLLRVETQICEPIDVGDTPIGQSAYWVSNQEVILHIVGLHPLHIFNIVTRELKSLVISQLSGEGEWYLGAVNVIPGTRILVVASKLRKEALTYAPGFFIVDIDAETMQPLPYNAYDLTDLYGVLTITTVNVLSVSPDGKYLFYAEGEYSQLVELKTGRVIASFRTTGAALWINDHDLLVQTRTSQSALSQIDAATGETVVLAIDQAAGGLLLSPTFNLLSSR